MKENRHKKDSQNLIGDYKLTQVIAVDLSLSFWKYGISGLLNSENRHFSSFLPQASLNSG